MNRNIAASSLALLLLAVTSTPSAALATDTYKDAKAPPENLSEGFASINEEQSEDWLSILVEGGFDGRGTGDEGYVRAATFVAGKLAEFGFQPMGDNGTYFQNLPYFQVTPDPEASSIKIGDVKISGADSLGFSGGFSDSTLIEGDLVVVKAVGESARITDQRDAIRGKIVLVTAQDVSNRFMFGLLRMGPKAIIEVVTEQPVNESNTVLEGRGARFGLTSQITQAAAEKLSNELGMPFSLDTEDVEGVEVQATEQTARIDFKAIRRPATVPNVVGWLEGSDPEVNDEYIVIGGHLDHLGVRNGQVYPGADDNGSGSTAILQVAQALHENPVKPRRSVLYIAFAAEELGLLGSNHFVKNPTQPLDKCITMFNIDMVGRNEETDNEPASENEESIHLIGSQQYTDALHELLLKCNEHVGFDFEYDEEERVFRRSDHYNFFVQDIPVAFVFGGFNPHYHQPSDGLNDINFSKIANCARLYYLAIHAVSDHGPFERTKPEEN